MIVYWMWLGWPEFDWTLLFATERCALELHILRSPIARMYTAFPLVGRHSRSTQFCAYWPPMETHGRSIPSIRILGWFNDQWCRVAESNKMLISRINFLWPNTFALPSRFIATGFDMKSHEDISSIWNCDLELSPNRENRMFQSTWTQLIDY